MFSIAFVVREVGPKQKSEYPFQCVESRKTLGVNLARDNIIQSWCNANEVTMNEDIPWWGPREKSRQFMQMIVEAFTEPGTIVIDCTAATSDFMYLCFYP